MKTATLATAPMGKWYARRYVNIYSLKYDDCTAVKNMTWFTNGRKSAAEALNHDSAQRSWLNYRQRRRTTTALGEVDLGASDSVQR